jgi:hypothetical protein
MAFIAASISAVVIALPVAHPEKSVSARNKIAVSGSIEFPLFRICLLHNFRCLFLRRLQGFRLSVNLPERVMQSRGLRFSFPGAFDLQ